jgi:8-oxo-dGTP pyrophosphatase MutT (NUDIX family)
MIDASILPAIRSRLAIALAPPCEKHRPLLVGCDIVGWLNDERAARLARWDGVFAVRDDGIAISPALNTAAARTEALSEVCAELARDGALTAWRDERYAVGPGFGATPYFLLERAAARYFGVKTYAVHVNGLVRGDHGDAMWIARRSATKAIDPGMQDNLIGGGIAAGASVAATLAKEAWEEAGVPAPLAQTAVAAGAVHICRIQPDGLQHETLFAHDLWLPAGFVPKGMDGEVAGHRLVALDESAHLIADGAGADAVTADASLIMLDCLIRHGRIAPDAPDYLALDALRHPGLPAALAR